MPSAEEVEQTPSPSKVVLGVVVAVVVLGGLTYAAYLYSNRKGGSVFPAGYPQDQPAAKPLTMTDIKCDDPEASYKTLPNFYIKCDPYKVSPTTKWVSYKDPVRGIAIEVPSDLKTAPYVNGLGFPWRTIAASSNLLVSYELADARTGTFKTMTGEDYPKNYWKQFGGLTGLKSFSPYTNKGGVAGWQAVYFYFTEAPTVDTFFEDPTVPGDFAHFSKGVLSDDVYNTVLDSFTWTPKSSPTPAPKTPVPAATPKPTEAPASPALP